MKLFALSLAGALALGTAALAQAPEGSQSQNTKASSGQTGQTTGQSGGTQIRTGTESRSQDSRRDVNVNVRMRSGPDAVVHRRTQRRVTVIDHQRPSAVVVKKKKKFVKAKRKRVIAAAPASRTTIIQKRRAGIAVRDSGISTRTTIRSERQPSARVNMRARVQSGSDTSVRSNTTTGMGGSATTGSGQNNSRMRSGGQQ